MGKHQGRQKAGPGRPNPEALRMAVGRQEETGILIATREAPPLEMVCASLTAVFSRPGTSHPVNMSKEEMSNLLKISFNLAEEARREYLRRYGQ
jgi:hypothetical protein